MMFAFISELSFFLQLVTNGPTGLREFLSFSRTKPLLPLHSEGKTAEQRHGRAQARTAGKSMRAAAWQLVVSWYVAHTTAERQIGWPEPCLLC